jgi:hypothetical protein
LAREVLASVSSLTELHAFLAELRLLELEADSRRLQLLLQQQEYTKDAAFRDEIVNSAQAAELLGRSIDWVYHNRPLLAPALASPPDSNPRYSRRNLEQLQRLWASK